jgi:hypothetical protein
MAGRGRLMTLPELHQLKIAIMQARLDREKRLYELNKDASSPMAIEEAELNLIDAQIEALGEGKIIP